MAKQSRLFRILNLISFPALDAPLVAGFWWWLFTVSFGGGVDWPILVALVSAVWAIYLFDRLFDVAKIDGDLPERKRFAAGHRKWLMGSLVLAGMIAIAAAIQLPGRIWIQGATVAVVTAFYFLIYRITRRSGWLPIKEILIGVCFAAGVGMPFDSANFSIAKIGALMVFAGICTVNCLMISQAELTYDRQNDPSAWFSESGRSFPFGFVFGSMILLVAGLVFYGLPWILAGSLLLSIVALALLHYKRAGIQKYSQVLADAAVWFPAIVGVVLTIF